MSATPANPLPTAKPKDITKQETWLLWRLPLFLFWWAVTAGFINRATEEELLPSYYFFFFLPFAAGSLILWRHWIDGWLARIVIAVWFVLYWLLFVIVAPAQVILWLPNGLKPVKRLWKLSMVPLHILFVLVYLPLLLLSWYVLCFSQRATVINPTVYLEIIFNTLILLVAMRWAADPMYPFIQFACVCLSLQTWWDGRTILHPGSLASEEAKKQGAQSRATFLGYYEGMFKSFDDFVIWLERRSIVAVFVGVLVLLFAFTVVGYGVCIYAMQRLQCQPPCYTELDTNLYQCSVYSLSVLTTAPLTNVLPNTVLAKFLYGMELISTFLIATVFFGMFSAAKGFHGEQRFEEYQKEAEKVFDWINGVKQKHSAILNPATQIIMPALPPPPPPPPSESPPK